jgi:hypothetical protein
MKSILSKFSYICLLYTIISFPVILYAESTSQEKSTKATEQEKFKKPYIYGEYYVITCKRVKDAGKWPISSSEHEVTSINGKELDKPFKTQVSCIDSFYIPGDEEVVISGYFTIKEIGAPGFPKGAPELEYMEHKQLKFHFLDFFIATGVRSPEEAKLRFEKEIISKRKQNK